MKFVVFLTVKFRIAVFQDVTSFGLIAMFRVTFVTVKMNAADSFETLVLSTGQHGVVFKKMVDLTSVYAPY
jgi:hypothetical protein